MKRTEFFTELKRRLSGLPQEDIDRSLEYYGEMLDDRMEEGIAEEAAVAALGSMEEITEQILSEVPLTKLVGHSLKPKTPLRGWTVALLIIGFPLWLPLLLTAGILLLTAYALLWVLVGVYYAVVLALGVGGIAGALSALPLLFTGNVDTAIFALSVGCIAMGCAILLFYFCRVAKYIFIATKKCVLWLKRKMLKKEAKI